MRDRSSKVTGVLRRAECRIAFCVAILGAGWTTAQDSSLYTDPQTGIQYRKQVRTVERPLVETRMEEKVVTYARPEVVTELEPATRTYFTPVVRYDWQPRWHGLWNPFSAPTLAYHYVPQTQWEARTETYSRYKTSTRWIAENRTVQEPKMVTTMQREQVVDWVAVGRVNPQSVPASSFPGNQAPGLVPGPAAGPSTQVASLRGMPAGPTTTPPTAGLRPITSGGMPATVLGDPYNTRPYSSGTVFR